MKANNTTPKEKGDTLFRIMLRYYKLPVILFLLVVVVFPIGYAVYDGTVGKQQENELRADILSAQEQEYHIYVDGVEVERVEIAAINLDRKDVKFDKQKKHVYIIEKDKGFFD